MKQIRNLLVGLGLAVTTVCLGAIVETDVCIYGSTPSGIAAAVQVARQGKSVVIVTPDKHLGGMSSSGLGFADTGNTAVIGGIAREFHQRVWRHYEQPEAWNWQARERYGNHGQGTRAKDDEAKTMWVFEPHVAERVFESFIAEHNIPVHRDEWLDRQAGVRKNGSTITEITTLSGKMLCGEDVH
jgi:glycine/D-amino acid oxidase-like deaminating enzyme